MAKPRGPEEPSRKLGVVDPQAAFVAGVPVPRPTHAVGARVEGTC